MPLLSATLPSSPTFPPKIQISTTHSPPPPLISLPPPSSAATRRAFLAATSLLLHFPLLPASTTTLSSSAAAAAEFFEIEGSGGVKALDLRIGEGEAPADGDQVISGIQAAVKSMNVGGVRRVVIPPSQGYQSTSQEPIPPNFFDRRRLFTTIFNPTRLANGESSTLGTLIFDIELVSVRHP